MIETILLACIWAKIKGYSLRCLYTEKAFYFLWVCEGFYWLMQVQLFNNNYEWLVYAALFKTIYLCSTLPLVYRYQCFKASFIGAGAVILGGMFNDLAIKANNGFMPVYPTLSYLTGYVKQDSFGVADKLHILGDASTKLKILTDYIDTGYSILSLGDVLIRVLPFLVLYASIRKAYELEGKKEVQDA